MAELEVGAGVGVGVGVGTGAGVGAGTDEETLPAQDTSLILALVIMSVEPVGLMPFADWNFLTAAMVLKP